MKLSQQEKAAYRAAFRQMNPVQKLDYLFTYYKAPIVLGLIAVFVLCSVLIRQLTKKETVLYVSLTNFTAGEDLSAALTEAFLESAYPGASRQEVSLYQDLYLSEDASTENHEYAYASRIKLMGTLQAQKLDIFLMNEEAYQILSANGYLLNLEDFLKEEDASFLTLLTPYLTSRNVILEDNAIAWQLGEASEHEVSAVSVPNGIEVTSFPCFEKAGLNGRFYAGIAANSPRLSAALAYLKYLAGN